MLQIYQRTAEPAEEPVSVAELLDFIKAVPQETALVKALGSVAREFVEEQTGRALVTQTWKLTKSGWPFERLVLERTPLASVTSVKYYPSDGGAQATLSTDVYRVINAGPNTHSWIELIDGQSWPELAARSDAIEVVFISGTAKASVKKQLVQAVCLLTKHLYDAGRNPVNVGNIVNEIPYTLRDFIAAQRVGGWFA